MGGSHDDGCYVGLLASGLGVYKFDASTQMHGFGTDLLIGDGSRGVAVCQGLLSLLRQLPLF